MIKFNVTVELMVDADANFLEVDRDHNEEVVEELFRDLLYDIDDIKVKSVKVREEEQ